MFTRLKQFTLVATLGILLSVAFAGTAVAEPVSVHFSMTQSSNPCVAPCTITVTDETPGAADHAWDFHYNSDGWGGHSGFLAEVTAGNSACLTPNCSQAKWTYDRPIGSGPLAYYQVAESVSNASGFDWKTVNVVEATDAPSEITLVGPSVKRFPNTLVLLSPKTNLRIESCFTGDVHTGAGYYPCKPYFVRKTGPDGSGLYHYAWRLPMAPPGEVKIEAIAWTGDEHNSDRKELTFTATGNRYRYGDFRSCFQPTVTAYGKHRNTELYRNFHLAFYAQMTTVSLLKFQSQVTQNGKPRWVTEDVERTKHPNNPLQGSSPYYRREAVIEVPGDRVSTKGTPHGPHPVPFRIVYEVKAGRKVLKKGLLSRKLCARSTEKEADGDRTEVV